MLARLLSLLCRSNTGGLCGRSLPFYTIDFSGQREYVAVGAKMVVSRSMFACDKIAMMAMDGWKVARLTL
jgi:hypothetical protein